MTTNKRKAVPRNRPEPRDAGSTWYSRSFTFDLGEHTNQGHVDPDYAKDQQRLAKCKQELAKCIGLVPETERFVHVTREVERLLGQHGASVQAVDNAPRASDYIDGYRQLETLSSKLSKSLQQTNPRLRELLEARLMESPCGNLESTEQAVDALAWALKELLRDMAHERSAGRPKNTSLRMTVQGLQSVFRKYYAGQRTAERRRGAIKINDDQTMRERRFVTVALKAARIDCNTTAAALAKLL